MKNTMLFLIVMLAGFFFSGLSLAQDVSQEAKRHMFRGQAAMEEASDASGYRDAVSEFKQATRLAPDWADAWFNLGVAQEKVGDLSGAMKSFQKYLDLNPNASDRNEVEALIYKLEYRNDKAGKEKAAKANLIRSMTGDWCEIIRDQRSCGKYNILRISDSGGDLQFQISMGTAIKLVGRIQGLLVEGRFFPETKYCPNLSFAIHGSVSSDHKRITLIWPPSRRSNDWPPNCSSIQPDTRYEVNKSVFVR